MMRKLLIVVFCGFFHQSVCSRMRFDQGFHEPVFRHDSHMPLEGVYKREHFFPRDSLPPPEQMLPPHGIIRSEPIYGNEAIMSHPPPPPPPPPPSHHQTIIPSEDFISSEQIMQNEPYMRREPFIRREPILRRESFIRPEPVIRTGRIFQNAPVIREGGLFRNEPNGFALMVTPCPCQEAQNMVQGGPRDTFYQIPQPIQPMQQQPMLAHRIIFSKPMIKSQGYQPIVAFPRFQRFVRKNFKPIAENIHFSGPPVQSTPVQEFTSFSSEPYSVGCQGQGQQAIQTENTSEPSQTTMRSIPQMPNPLTLAQMSSIC